MMNQLISNVLMQLKPTDAVEHLTLIEKLEKEKNNWHDDGENNVHRVIDDCIDIVKQHEKEIKESFELLADNFEHELIEESKNYLLERNAIFRLMGSEYD